MKPMRAAIAAFFYVIVFTSLANAQTGIMSTYVGPPAPVDGAAATDSAIDDPRGVESDGAGGFYVVSWSHSKVYRVTSGGVIHTVAGTGTSGFGGDGGPATAAQLNKPSDIAVDAFGNLYIADTGNNRIRKVASGGAITTVAGNGAWGLSGDGGPATSAQFNAPQGIAIDGAGNLYIADTFNSRIRKVTPDGVISTVAGNGDEGAMGDGGPATSAELYTPEGVAVDGAGDLYIADTQSSRIRKVSGGIISTVAGTGFFGFSGDGGPATSAQLYYPNSVAFDAAGNLYVSDSDNARIRKITPGGVITTIAGGVWGSGGDGGPATSAELTGPAGVAVDAAGNVFIADYSNKRVRKISPGGVITTVAGNGSIEISGDDGPAASARLFFPVGVAVDGAGNVYIADPHLLSFRVRKVSPTGVITAFAGKGVGGPIGDGGPATDAQLSQPWDMAADGAGNLYIATPGGSRVRMVSPDGIITTIAGTGIQGFSGDGGPATSARLRSPTGIAVDGAGNLYIADPHDNRIRKVTPAGIISTVAGNGVSGFSGDGGPATSAQLSEPGDVAVDGAGNLFILDSLNNRIRKVTPDGVIATVAGNGTAGFSGDDGPATSAQLFITYFTAGLAVDSLGNLYIADTGNGAIRKVTPAGVITTVAGNGIIGFSGDGGRAESSQLFFVRGLAVDGLDNLYAADSDNNRIRKITMGLSTVFGPPPLRGDFNGDGKSDILWQHGDGSAALWLMNGSVPGGSGALLGAKTGWQVRKLGDFNADGKSDILLQHASGNTTMWLMNGLDVAGSVGLVSAATGWAVKDVGDFNGDGASDILWQHTDGSAALWLMNGTSVTGSSGLTGPASGWTVSQLGDFNGDGKTDILWRHSDGATVIWLMDGTTIIATSDTLSAPASGWRAEKLGDFNGDGKTDLIWQHSDGSAALWLMDGTTAVGANGLVGAGTGWSVNHVGDFNGDGKADLLWRHVDGSVTLLLMDGTTVNEANGLVGAGTGWSVKRIGDFSGDGKADIVWQQTNGTAVILLMNGTTVIGNDSLIGAGSGWIPTP